MGSSSSLYTPLIHTPHPQAKAKRQNPTVSHISAFWARHSVFFQTWKRAPLCEWKRWSVKSEDLSVKIRRRLTRAVFRSPWEKECVCECVCSTVFWAGGNVRDVLGGVHVGVRGGGRRHYRWFSTPSALLKTYTPLVFKVSTQSCPCVSWNCPGSEIRRGERVWWLTGDTVAVSGGLKTA